VITLSRRLGSEFLGSTLLAMIVVGSGIAAQQLSPTDIGLQLLENALVTGVGLFFLIEVLGPLGGAEFNPIVSLAKVALTGRPLVDALRYIPFQVAGCISGAILANAMFALPLVNFSTHHRVSGPHFLSEVIATAGLVITIFLLVALDKGKWIAGGVAAYITGAYFFTSSTSFANPAITVGRMFSNSFAGIAPSSVLFFIAAQVVGGVVGVLIVKGLAPQKEVS
jgi:glycerol uptake facilitator-like aquaporin